MNELLKLMITIGVNNTEAINAMNETSKSANNTANKIVGFFKKVGGAVATYFAVSKIKDFGVEIVQTAANVQAENAQFEASFKDLSDEANKMFERVGKSTGVFASRLKVTGTKAYSQFKGAGLDANKALENTETFLNLASDAAAYYDISLEDAETRIRSFLRGNVEAGDAIGLFTSESQRNQYAVEMYGKKWIKLSEAQKQNLMLNVAEDIYTQSGAIGQAARESDGLANVTGNLKETWRQFLAVVGAPVLKAVTPILQNLATKVQELQGKWVDFQAWLQNNKFFQALSTTIQGVVDKLKSLKDWIIENKDHLLNLVTAIGVLIATWAGFKLGTTLQNMVQGFQKAKIQLALYTMEMGTASLAQGALNGSLTLGQTIVGIFTGKIKLTTLATELWHKAQSKLNMVLSMNPIALVVAAIAALVAIFVVAYKKSESFREIVDKLWKAIKNSLLKAFEEIKPVLEEVIEALKELWATIKELVEPVIKGLVKLIKQYMPAIKAVISAVITWFTTSIKNVLIIVKTVFNQIKTAIKTALNVIKNVIKLFTAVLKGDWKGAWEAIKNIFKSIWSGIKSTASNVLGGLKSIFSNTWNGIKSATTKIWNGIYKSVTNPVKKAMDKVKKYIDKIKGFFTGFTAKMKLPHFKIKNASLNPKDWIKNGVPKLAVEWYAKGGILNKPTVFDYNPLTNTAKVGGEAEAEAIAPIGTLLGMIEQVVKAENSGLSYAVQRLYDIVAAYLPTIAENSGHQIVLDKKKLVGELLPDIDNGLGSRYNRKARY